MIGLDARDTPDAIARAALAHWRLADAPLASVQQRENLVFRVGLPGGAAALRLHRAGYHDAAALDSELMWLEALHAQGLPVPRPIPTAAGALSAVVVAHGVARRADLLEWLDGEPLGASGSPLAGDRARTRRVFAALGQAMARLHAASDAWVRPPGFTRHHWDRDGLVGDSPFWGRFWDVRELPGASDADAALLLAGRDHARAALGALPATLDYGLVHADLVRENVLVAGEAVRLLDFDDAGFGWRLFDIATALVKNRTEPDADGIAASLLDGYCAVRSLAGQALDHLPLFMMLRAFTYLGWVAARRHEPGNAARLPRLLADARHHARACLEGGGARRGG